MRADETRLVAEDTLTGRSQYPEIQSNHGQASLFYNVVNRARRASQIKCGLITGELKKRKEKWPDCEEGCMCFRLNSRNI
jgi:hypothetical protein